jgi:hypothetical protein
LAILRLMTNSTFVDWTAGRSPGLGGLISYGIGRTGDLSTYRFPCSANTQLLRTRRLGHSATALPQKRDELPRLHSTPLVGAEEECRTASPLCQERL